MCVSWMLLVVLGLSEHEILKVNSSTAGLLFLLFLLLAKTNRSFFPMLVCKCLCKQKKNMHFSMLAFLTLIDKTKISGELPLELFLSSPPTEWRIFRVLLIITVSSLASGKQKLGRAANDQI